MSVNPSPSLTIENKAALPQVETSSLERLEAQFQAPKQKLFSHLPFLDGLRALSIFAVMAFHSNGPLGAFVFKKGGWVGVDAFFVISGFLITAILLKEQDKSGTLELKNFYMRRALRLVPAFSLWIVITSILRILHHKFSLAGAGIAAIYMADYDLALGWGNIIGSGFEIAWSLSVEEKFYLIWPSIVKVFRKSLFWVGIAAIVGCFAWRSYLICSGVSWIRICGAFDTKIDALMIGCVAAILLNNPAISSWLKEHLNRGAIAFSLLVFIVFYIRGMGHPSGAHTIYEQFVYWNVRLPIFTLAFAALIVSLCSHQNGWAARALSFAPIAWVGRVSYSLYLWHVSAFAWAVWSDWQIRPMNCTEMEVTQYAWALVFAAVSFYLIERPFLKMKDRFSFNATNRIAPKMPVHSL